MNTYLKTLLESLNKTQIDIIKEINQLQGCEESISRATLYRWMTQNFTKESKNQKQKGIICFCQYLNLNSEQIHIFLKYLGIEDLKQINEIESKIQNFKSKSVLSFNGENSLEISEFAKMLIENQLVNHTSIILENNCTSEILLFEDFTLDYKQDNYIRNISVNKLSIGCSDASIEDVPAKSIKFILENKKLEEIISLDQYLRFNYYKLGDLADINLKQQCYLNQTDFVISYLRNNKDYRNCPINIFLECMDKKISLEKRRRIFDGLKVLKDYDCFEYSVKKLLEKLNHLLKEKQTDLLIKIYIFEFLASLYKNKLVTNFIWDNVKLFINNNLIDHPHALWSCLVALQKNKKSNYSYFDQEVIIYLHHLIKTSSWSDVALTQLIERLMCELKIIYPR